MNEYRYERKTELPPITWSKIVQPPLSWKWRIRYALAERLEAMAEKLRGY